MTLTSESRPLMHWQCRSVGVVNGLGKVNHAQRLPAPPLPQGFTELAGPLNNNTFEILKAPC